ncbi:antibiotic biosynthesis monooxygenase family protein [Paenibacillus gansuensis]|uniref:Antibiotic biosynthesis monooxygenase family protein n=1 Tax=Paenibacillus gansuensis TaxID=306542 RepID=A0ABW5PB37_9BACL
MMYARFGMLRLRNTTPLSFAEQLASQKLQLLRSVKGFRGITFLGEKVTNEFATISYWESEEDVIAAGKIIASEISGSIPLVYLESPPVVIIYEVYEPSTGLPS